MIRSRILHQTNGTGRFNTRILTGFAALILLATSLSAQPAENTVTLYLGTSSNAAGVFELRESTSTDLRYSSVGWDTEPFENTPYFGLRFTRWLARNPNHGWSIDYTHNKALARLELPVVVEGVRNGAPVDDREILGDSFTSLELNGLNSLMFNYHYRWLTEEGQALSGFLRPYLGIGAGPMMPNVDITTDFSSTDEFQYGGFGGQFLAGLDLQVSGIFSINFEYKFLVSRMNLDLQKGGAFSINPDTSHFLIGFNFTPSRKSTS